MSTKQRSVVGAAVVVVVMVIRLVAHAAAWLWRLLVRVERAVGLHVVLCVIILVIWSSLAAAWTCRGRAWRVRWTLVRREGHEGCYREADKQGFLLLMRARAACSGWKKNGKGCGGNVGLQW